MKRAVAPVLALLAGAAIAADKKTYNFACKGGYFSITATVDGSNGAERWSKTDPVILQIGSESPQTLIADPDAPDADSYKNKDFEFYALKNFITLTHKSHGVVVQTYSACRVE
jgi:hypothetical protein